MSEANFAENIVPEELSESAPRGAPLHALIGFVLFATSIALFLFIADRIFRAGYLAPLLGLVWAPNPDPASASGQWLVEALYGAVTSIPHTGPELLVIVTATLAAGAVGLFAAGLRRRGWPALTAACAAALLAVHPVTLYLASTGQPVVLSMVAICIVIVSVDRAGALGDTQSLMGLGLAFALLFVTEPNALYIVLPALLILPTTLDEMRDGGSAAALFVIVLIPPVIAVGAVLMGGLVEGITPAASLRHWLAVLHGSMEGDQLAAPWLARNGGTFVTPLLDISGLCVVCFPATLLVLWRLFFRRRRIRFGTACLALLTAPLSGAIGAWFWHPEPWWSSVATGMVAVATWTLTVPMRAYERRIWLAALAMGVLLSWFGPWLWDEPDKAAWRAALLGG